MKSRTAAVFVIASLTALAACQKAPKQDADDGDGDGAKVTSTSTFAGGGGAQTTGQRGKLVIPFGIEHSSFALTGTPASSYSVNLAGCLSGYSATVTEANLDGVEVYSDDRNCLAKLVDFVTGGVTYNGTNGGATNFTTWLAGDTAIFTSAGGAKIRVRVVSQLASPITGTEAIVYQFSELLDATGDKTFTEDDVSDAHLITVASQEAPHFNVVGASFLGMDDTTGAPEFAFKLECVDDPTAVSPTSIAMTAGSAANSLCGANDLNALTYKLVKDTYSSTPTITDAETIFGTAGIAVTLPTDQYADSATNEGFNTVTIDGPGGLGTAGNEHMILMLKAGVSYTYFNVDVTTIVQ